MTKYKKALGISVLSLLAVLVAAGPALAEGVAPGESGGGLMPLGGGETDNGDIIEITAPDDITGWSLRPGQDNTQEGTLKVNASGPWSVTVNDTSATTAGKMTEYNTTTGNYIAENPIKLAANMTVKATGVNGTDTYQTLPVGDIIAQNTTSGTGGSEVSVPVVFKQDISWSDPVSAANRGYKIVITFTGSVA